MALGVELQGIYSEWCLFRSVDGVHPAGGDAPEGQTGSGGAAPLEGAARAGRGVGGALHHPVHPAAERTLVMGGRQGALLPVSQICWLRTRRSWWRNRCQAFFWSQHPTRVSQMFMNG